MIIELLNYLDDLRGCCLCFATYNLLLTTYDFIFFMNIEELRNFALSLQEVEESFPFGEDTLVFKTRNKIFLLVSLSSVPLQFNVKCNPDKAVELREQYSSVLPGYHMNKKHWNTIIVDGEIPRKTLCEFIKDSHQLVAGVSSKKKK